MFRNRDVVTQTVVVAIMGFLCREASIIYTISKLDASFCSLIFERDCHGLDSFSVKNYTYVDASPSMVRIVYDFDSD